jgi:hypothetical protein
MFFISPLLFSPDFFTSTPFFLQHPTRGWLGRALYHRPGRGCAIRAGRAVDSRTTGYCGCKQQQWRLWRLWRPLLTSPAYSRLTTPVSIIITITLLHHSTTPPLHHSTTPPLHHSTTPNTPPLHHSTTPPFHHSTTPPLHH